MWYLCGSLAKSDHHILFVFADEKKKTKKIDSELNPVWNEVIYFFNQFLVCIKAKHL